MKLKFVCFLFISLACLDVFAEPPKSFCHDLQELIIAAKQGDISSQLELGNCYQEMGGEDNLQQAVKWWRKAATHPDYQAIMNSYADVLKYSKRYEVGEAQYNLGYYYFSVDIDLCKSLKWWQHASFLGSDVSHNNLGWFYENGFAVKQDLNKALFYYKKSEVLGGAVTYNNLGRLFEKGAGVKRDHKKAFHYYNKSAKLGYIYAQNNLGICYEKGIGVAKNKMDSLKWYSVAARQGDIYAQYNLARKSWNPSRWNENIQEGPWIQDKFSLSYNHTIINKNIFNIPISEDKDYLFGLNYLSEIQDLAKAAKHFEKAALKGHKDSQNNLGWCYSIGAGVKKDLKKAFELWVLSAEQGSKDAQYNLGLCLYLGKGTKKNLSEAFKWFEKSAKQGHSQAQNNLGWCYEKGYGVKKNLKLAAKWYIKSANQGNIVAQYNMGRCFGRKDCSFN